ncbi:alpha/beta hydrolase [Planococcus sp. CP5-4]|uniref:alpha/beta family hydrolase n=1 Tax=unclassified Planococcus (in: firmicutes) TaxID=2662419 RepID=UPI001C22ACEE|nr:MULTISPECIES: alpha/beta family hydrolase [unclassified Planococcus (in: firmicutes)]MBU9674031.1 alpha/beta hydrolase [Planococcus sp. CP5-4_YE]MBV0909902.1 alpha/beta hydrolase [Planococcus sp. CP5-4_UN]MBW6064782.1 alpha/beta hydrolase [Planococcus sp. CP5-4]
MKTINRTIKTDKGQAVNYSLVLNQDQTRKLAIFLPGIGYTAKSPLFHYTERLLAEQEYDILRINYDYDNPLYDDYTMTEIEEAVKQDAKQVIDQVLKGSIYEKFFLVAKSLGTIALANELARKKFTGAKTVWLTPLIKHEDIFEAMKDCENPALSFIGDKDHYYDRNRMEELQGNSQLDSQVLKDVNHGMDFIGDPLKSIDVLKDVITDIHAFSKKSTEHA